MGTPKRCVFKPYFILYLRNVRQIANLGVTGLIFVLGVYCLNENLSSESSNTRILVVPVLPQEIFRHWNTNTGLFIHYDLSFQVFSYLQFVKICYKPSHVQIAITEFHVVSIE